MPDYVDMAGPSGQEDNMGGTTQKIYLARVADFTTIEGRPAAPATLADIAVIPGNHVFAVGKGFFEFYCTMDKGNLKYTVQGDRDGRSFKATYEGFHPGNSDTLLGWATQGKNDRFIALIEMPNGELHQLGSNSFYAELRLEYDSGTNSSGTNGWKIIVESMETGPQKYEGTLTLAP